MTAEKENKVYIIDESQSERYRSDGFDIRDNDGNIVAYGKGKTVPYGEYAKLRAENEQLRAEISGMKKGK